MNKLKGLSTFTTTKTVHYELGTINNRRSI